MATPFLGEIKIFSFNFPPQGWALCNGQLLPINQNQALFALLGTTFGGNGQTTFALPDLRGRVTMGEGANFGGPNHTLGERAGEEAHTLLISEMPAHNHLVSANSGGGTQASPQGNFWAKDSEGNPMYAAAANVALNPAAIGSTGGSQPHLNMMPYTVLNFCIALQGIFPSRN
jgi:microcystin-dependent protein